MFKKISIAFASLATLGSAAQWDIEHMDEIQGDFIDFGKNLACKACTTVFDGVDKVFTNQKVISGMEFVATGICDAALFFISDPVVCPGAVHTMGDYIVPLGFEAFVSPNYICDEMWGLCDNPNIEALDLDSYVSNILSTKPDSIKNNDFIDNLYASIYKDGKLTDRETITMVQIADPHLDFEYTVGALAECDAPICCRSNSGHSDDPTKLAEYWGNINCDIPHNVLKNMVEFINEEIHPDALMWTGDNSAHNIWDNSWDEIINYTNNITNTIKDAFGPSTDITVLPIQGNHDTWPVNVQSFDKPYQNKAINEYKDSWKGWLTDESLEQFSKWGYYSQDLVLANGKKVANTKVIGINTQTCNNMNWYLFGQRNDPGNELAWLEQELASMEQAGEIAIIMAHIPPTDCLHEWGARYRAIMDRYQHVVRFSTFGHTHKEEPKVVKAIEDDKYIALNFVAGSGTTMTDLFPCFTLFTLDAELMIPLEIETYYFDVIKANQGNPEWKLLHDYTTTYGMKDLSPSSFGALFERLLVDNDFAHFYDRMRHRRDTGEDLEQKDIKKLYCDATNTENWKYKECLGWHDEAYWHDTVTAVFEHLTNPWIKTN